MENRILIAGVGNLLFSDEGIGVHVIRELSKRNLPEGVELADIGTATFELNRLMDGKRKVIIVDAIFADGTPGAIYRLSPDDFKSGKNKFTSSLHQFGVLDALKTPPGKQSETEVVILGVIPKDYHTLSMDLTPELKEQIPSIIEAVLKELN
jgi:hydrogenase maturation protease